MIGGRDDRVFAKGARDNGTKTTKKRGPGMSKCQMNGMEWSFG